MLNNEIQHILSGKSQIRFGTAIQAAASYLAGSQTAGTMAKDDKHFKAEETKRLIKYIEDNKLWIDTIDVENYVSEGAEQKVYINGEKSVLKLNDAIYYLSWIDYLQNLLIIIFSFRIQPTSY